MNERIIYPTDNGGVAIIIPSPDCGLTIEEIAAKDVPPYQEIVDGETVTTARPYKIVDVSDIPSDRTFRNAWEYVE
jgi:hypothetical protein